MRISDRDDGLTRRMPAHILQWSPYGGGVCPYDDCTTLEIKYLTDEHKLRQYVPEGHEHDAHGSCPVAPVRKEQ
jgi:hypothetical protein